MKMVKARCPMSPLLFALGLEYLSRCLESASVPPDFEFHPRCEKLGITHMMFVDDLLMFCRVDKNTVKVMFDAFTKFSEASGLVGNLHKNDVYMTGISRIEEIIMLRVWAFLKVTFLLSTQESL